VQRNQWTELQKQRAMELFEQHGAAEASKQTGIPIATISSWARRAGKTASSPERSAQVAAKLHTIAERKGALVLGMLSDIERLRLQLFAPTVEKKAMVVSLGHAAGSELQIAEVELDHPTFAGQNQIVASLTTLLDKVLLLSGDATARIEQTGVAAESRAKAEGVVLALAKRAA
jgi:hypothetical protein